MFKTKLFASILLIAAVLFVQVGMVAAAPPAQDPTPITGNITAITTDTDSNGTTTILVTLVENGVERTVRLSVETAASLNLVEVDSETGLPVLDPNTGLPVVDDTQVGQDVTIDPTKVIPDAPVEEVEVHPISALLASFFGMDGAVVDGYHQDGFGFGVIAQALWMSQNLNGDATTAGLILEAKKSGDYSAFTLPDGSTPTNWGQFKKAVSGKKNNLGVIVSGKAENETTDPAVTQQEHGNGKDNNNGKDKGNGKDNNNGKGKP